MIEYNGKLMKLHERQIMNTNKWKLKGEIMLYLCNYFTELSILVY